MTYDAVHTGELDIGRVFQRTFGVLGRNLPTLLILGVVFVGAPDVLLRYGSGSPQPYTPGQLPTINWSVFAAAYVLFFAGIGLYNMAAVRVALDDADGKRASPIDGVATIFRFLLPGLAAGFLVLIGGVFTYMLLIIPGVIFLLTYFVVLPVIVAEKAGVFQSFRRSAQLTRGRRGALFGALFLIGIITGIANLIFVFALGMIVPTFTKSPLALDAATGLLAGVMSSVSATFGAVVYLRLVELHSGVAKAKVDEVFA